MNLQTLFSGIAGAIREKDGTTETIAASNFPERIRNIPTGDPLDPVEVYKATRPADWLPMPEPADNEMYLLFHIPDGASALLAFRVTCADSYQIEFGTVINNQFVSQSSDSAASGVYETELFSDDFGDLTSSGMKQCMVKISGSSITSWRPNVHSKRGSSPHLFCAWNIVEIACRLPSCTRIMPVQVTGSVVGDALVSLRYFAMYGENSVTSLDQSFRCCVSLVAILALDTSACKNFSNTFQGCNSLVAVPKLNLEKANSINYTFSQCSSLRRVEFIRSSPFTSVSDAFNGCYSLERVDGFISCTYYTRLFQSCYSLKSIAQLGFSTTVNLNNAFRNCSSLVALPVDSFPAVSSLQNAFSNCYVLKSIPKIDTTGLTNISGAFSECYSLEKLEFDPDVVDWDGLDISISNCSFGHQALVDLFNSLSAIVTNHKLTITGNYGVSELTDAEKEIATQKNWTLVL